MTLYDVQKNILDALAADVRTLWSPRSIEFALPDTFGEQCGKESLPKAYIVLAAEKPAQDDARADRCGGWALLDWEIHLRECRDRSGTEWMTKNKVRRAGHLRTQLFGTAIPASYLGHDARWKGGTITSAGDYSDAGASGETVRTIFRFDLLVETDDPLY